MPADPTGAFRSCSANGSMMAGVRWSSYRRRWRPPWRWIAPAASSATTTRPMWALTARSIPIAAASMAVSTVLPVPPMLIWGSRPGSISRVVCSTSPRRPNYCARSWAGAVTPVRRWRSVSIPMPISRRRKSSASPASAWRCCVRPIIPLPSSPSRR